ncbi:MAG: type II secretion system major pseudopilin GspG [Hyphomicrobium sp.]
MLRKPQTNSRRRAPQRPSAMDGFTLLELLVVLGILALLAAIAGPSVLRYMGTARTETAKAQIASLATATELFALDMGASPSTDMGLAALVAAPQGATRWRGPYLKNANGLIDPWGRKYHYRSPGQRAPYEIFSYGQDNAPGGDGENQDLVSW